MILHIVDQDQQEMTLYGVSNLKVHPNCITFVQDKSFIGVNLSVIRNWVATPEPAVRKTRTVRKLEEY